MVFIFLQLICKHFAAKKYETMTHDELWITKWQEIVDFIEINHRNPSKYIAEERNMRSWLKYNRKLMNAGKLKAERLEKFEELLRLGEENRHVNQFV